MKLKSRELIKSTLDYAVAKVMSILLHLFPDGNKYPNVVRYLKPPISARSPNFNPSTSWLIGGEFIHYGEMEFSKVDNGFLAKTGAVCVVFGETHLTAGMRALVLDCYGEEIEIPDELCKYVSDIPYTASLGLEVCNPHTNRAGVVTAIDRYSHLLITDPDGDIVTITWENGNISYQPQYLLDKIEIVRK